MIALLMNTVYTVVTYIAAFTIGFGSWLGWALIICAVLQTVGVLASVRHGVS